MKKAKGILPFIPENRQLFVAIVNCKILSFVLFLIYRKKLLRRHGEDSFRNPQVCNDVIPQDAGSEIFRSYKQKTISQENGKPEVIIIFEKSHILI